jgi:Ca2+/Na+ antiporter
MGLFWVILLLLIFMLISFIKFVKGKIVFLLIPLFVLFAGYFFYIILMTKAPFTLYMGTGRVWICLLIGFLLLFVSTVLYILLNEFQFEEGLKNKGYGISGLILIIVGFLPLLFLSSGKKIEKRVIFYERGLLDWKTPDFTKFGAKSGGRFGILPSLLRENGYRVSFTDLDGNIPKGSILVLINILEPFSENQKKILDEFLINGGSILALGEHTNMAYSGDAFNDFFSSYGLKINFDSAKNLVYGWEHCLSFPYHPITTNLEDETEVLHWIGASVEAGGIPILLGKYAFSDRGDREAEERAFLGNMIYEPGERIGDIPLAVEKKVGKGKILLFGDTSSFQNPTLPMTADYVLRVFEWLRKENPGISPSIFLTISVLTLAGIILTLFSEPVFFLLPSLLIILGGFKIVELRERIKTEIEFEKLALIDISHGERFDLMAWEDESIGGLIHNLMRNKYFPYILREFDGEKIGKADLLFIIAPTKSFKGEEIRVIEDFIKRGGTVFHTVGWEERRGSLSLLEHFNMGIGNEPLGPGRYENERGFKVFFKEAWPIISENPKSEVIAEIFDLPVIVYQPFERGGYYLIGDSHFLLNPNLEHKESYVLENIHFFMYLLERLKK